MERDSINALMEKTEQWILPELENVFTPNEAEDITVKAALYSLYAGGKRLRPMMMHLTSSMLNLDESIDNDVKYFAATLEMIKRYDVVLWEKHGTVAVGPDIMEAFDQTDVLNKAAILYKTAKQFGFTPEGLTPEAVGEIRDVFHLPSERHG